MLAVIQFVDWLPIQLEYRAISIRMPLSSYWLLVWLECAAQRAEGFSSATNVASADGMQQEAKAGTQEVSKQASPVQALEVCTLFRSSYGW